MKYSDHDKNVIFKMKITIVNEFKYRYATRSDIGFLANFVEPDMAIDIDDLHDACRMGIDHHLIENLRKSKFQELFSEALAELFSEDIIIVPNNKNVIMTKNGENMFIENNMLYSVVGQR